MPQRRDYLTEGEITFLTVGDVDGNGANDIVLFDNTTKSLVVNLADSAGHLLSMKTEAFYRALRERMQPGGIVMFNMLAGPEDAAYRAGIRSAGHLQGGRVCFQQQCVVCAASDKLEWLIKLISIRLKS